MRTIKFNRYFIILTLQFLLSVFCNAQPVKSETIPEGNIEKFDFNQSKIFPGTVREVTVYIPRQINPSIPVCVYVQQDGFNTGQHLNNMLDTLIHNKEIPVTVAIFVKPGFLRGNSENVLGRPNRCFEYDELDSNYVSFLLEEILPYVAKKYDLNLSKKGNDRCIGGCSSGGIAAFNAAWERPDAFSRVYCVSGSFVAFRGGNEMPVLIRKTEAKPIRAYLTTGTDDMENCAGDWTLIDQEMGKALKFSGYDYQFHLLNGSHCVGFKDFFADAMRYLWKNWPEPVKAGASAPRVNDILLPGEPWHLLAEGYADVRGPACNAKGEVFFTDIPNNKIYRIDTQNPSRPQSK